MVGKSQRGDMEVAERQRRAMAIIKDEKKGPPMVLKMLTEKVLAATIQTTTELLPTINTAQLVPI